MVVSRTVALTFVALAALAACGARTGLYAVGPTEDDEDDDSASGEILRLDAGVRDAATVAPVTCTPGVLTLAPATPTVLFAIDRSQSMSGRLAGSNERRWNALKSALGNVLPSVDARIRLGSLIFPSGNGSRGAPSCDVLSAPILVPDLGNSAAILDALDATSPGGATPTADAMRLAANTLGAVRAASKARAIVLATDGGPDCNANLDPATCDCLMGRGDCNEATRCLDADRTITIIEDVAAAGIPTYVVGLLGTGNDQRFDAVLDRMAVAGGKPQAGATSYYPATSEAELEGAFTAIRDQVGACIFLTTSVPDAGGTIDVRIDGTLVPYDQTGATGWSWADQDNGEILFAGDACPAATASASVSAEVACADR